jgi:hypothetical protein
MTEPTKSIVGSQDAISIAIARAKEIAAKMSANAPNLMKDSLHDNGRLLEFFVSGLNSIWL